MSRNGLLTSRELGSIPGTSHRVRKDLVVQTAALRAAFAAHFGKPLNLTDSYRPYSVQERIFRERFVTYNTGHTDTRVWNGQRWWRRHGVASCATPGTSNHGWGTAIDWSSRVNVGGSAEQKWMAANAHRFAWTWPTWARNPRSTFYEPWHYEATPVPVAHYRAYLIEHRISVPDVPALAPLVPEDTMSIENVRLGIHGLLKEAAERSTPTGRQVADFLTGVLVGPMWGALIGSGDNRRSMATALARAEANAAAASAKADAILDAVKNLPGVDPDQLAAKVAAAVKRAEASLDGTYTVTVARQK